MQRAMIYLDKSHLTTTHLYLQIKVLSGSCMISWQNFQGKTCIEIDFKTPKFLFIFKMFQKRVNKLLCETFFLRMKVVLPYCHRCSVLLWWLGQVAYHRRLCWIYNVIGIKISIIYPIRKRLCIIIPPAQRSCWGGILVSLRPSVRPSVCPSVRPSVPHAVSALYHLQLWMDSFHNRHKWSLPWEGVSRTMTFDLDLYLQGHLALT